MQNTPPGTGYSSGMSGPSPRRMSFHYLGQSSKGIMVNKHYTLEALPLAATVRRRRCGQIDAMAAIPICIVEAIERYSLV